MPKNRLVVASAGLPTISRQPAARPIDTYSAEAARARGADLAAFAGALGQVAPKLQGLAIQLQEQKRTEGIARGKARLAELIQEQADFGAAVRQGLIEAKDSPFFRAGLLEAAGIVAGDRYGDVLRTQFGEIPDRTNLAAFDEMQTRVYNEVVGAFGPEESSKVFQAAFQNRALGHTQSLRQAFANGVSPALLEQRVDLLYSETAETINTAIKSGYSKEQLGEALTRIADAAYAQGLRGPLVNDTLVRAFTAAAVDLAEDDPYAARQLLDSAEFVLSGPKDGKRAKLFLSNKAQEALVKASSDVAAVEQNRYRFNAFRKAEEQRIATEELVGQAMDLYLEAEDVDDVNIEPLILQATQQRLTSAISVLQNMRETYRTARWYTDQEVMAEAEIEIWKPGSTFSVTDVARLVNLEKISGPDGRILRGQISSRDSYLSQGQAGPLADPYFNQFPAGWFSRQFKEKWGFQGGFLGKLTDLAMGDFRQEFLKKWESGTWEEMSPVEKGAWLQETAQAMVDLRGGGRDIIQSIREPGAANPVSFHDPAADWTTTIVLSRGEIQRLSKYLGTAAEDLLATITEEDMDLFELYIVPTRENIEAFIAAQVGLLLGVTGEDTETKE